VVEARKTTIMRVERNRFMEDPFYPREVEKSRLTTDLEHRKKRPHDQAMLHGGGPLKSPISRRPDLFR